MSVQPPSPDWNAQFSEGSHWLFATSWMILFSTVAISIWVIAIHLLADGLMQASRR